MQATLPNILTLFRLIAAPCLVVVFLILSRPLADWIALCLFVGAAVTDWIDGYLARRWQQVSRFGTMLDPIADKVMVILTLLVICGFADMDPLILLPATVILFREVFVSGLREYLGHAAATLKVTPLAKWKTTLQMLAITFLLSTNLFAHGFFARTVGMDGALVTDILQGIVPDDIGLTWYHGAAKFTWWAGVVLLWISAILTAVTGFDYFRKSLPYLRQV